MQDVLGRVRALIARAGSDNEHEAAASALQACRLLREHRLVISLPEPMPENVHRVVTAPPPSPMDDRLRQVEAKAWSMFDALGRAFFGVSEGGESVEDVLRRSAPPAKKSGPRAKRIAKNAKKRGR